MMPSRSTSTWRARAAGENLAPVMKDDSGLAVTRPGMLTPSLENKAIFGLQCSFDQAHVIFFASVAPMRAPHS